MAPRIGEAEASTPYRLRSFAVGRVLTLRCNGDRVGVGNLGGRARRSVVAGRVAGPKIMFRVLVVTFGGNPIVTS